MDLQKNEKLLRSYLDDLFAIIDTLTHDLKRMIEVSEEINRNYQKFPYDVYLKEQPTWFRMANRITITIIESVCYKMKQTALFFCDLARKPLTPKQREKLDEKKSDGTFLFVNTKDNIKLAFEKLAYAMGIEFKLKYGTEWQTFLKVLKKRHDLTHPKIKKDLNMSPSDHRRTAETMDWFKKTIEKFGDQIKKSKGQKKKALEMGH